MLRGLLIPQVRRTWTVLGTQPPGAWGFDHGVNEHQVVAGCLALPSQEAGPAKTLRAIDLVRLALERSRTAAQAVDSATQLLEQFGPCSEESGLPSDHAMLVADPQEAYVVETAGRHWGYQEVKQVRAVSNVRVIRQDWDRISHGLAQAAIEAGRWPADGSKLDLALSLGLERSELCGGMRRWGRVTLWLEQFNGQLDTPLLRRLLADHDEQALEDDAAPLCRHDEHAEEGPTSASLVVDLGATPERLPIAWRSFGAPCLGLYFPTLLEGELPEAFADLEGATPLGRLPRLVESWRGDAERWNTAREVFGRLQARFDAEADEFAAEGAAMKERGEQSLLERHATLFMQHHLERFEEAVSSLTPRRTPLRGPRQFAESRLGVP
jgi:secernin